MGGDVLDGQEITIVTARDGVHRVLNVVVEPLQDGRVALLCSELELLLRFVEGLAIQRLRSTCPNLFCTAFQRNPFKGLVPATDA